MLRHCLATGNENETHRTVASLTELRGNATFLLQLYYRKELKLLTISHIYNYKLRPKRLHECPTSAVHIAKFIRKHKDFVSPLCTH